jgi:uncharacterized protein DUF3224
VTRTASGTFTVDTFENEPADERDGVSTGGARLTKTFSGDLEATGSVHMLTVLGGGAARAYVAIERVIGSLHGRRGSFVLRHSATDVGGAQTQDIAVAPGSGTGELSGISGAFVITIGPDGGHGYTFDYSLG